MDAKSAQALLDGSPPAEASSLTPLTSAAMLGNANGAPKPDLTLGEPSREPSVPPDATTDAMSQISGMRKAYQEQNQQGDIPLDIDSGLGAFTRSMLSFRGTPEDKKAYLEKKYGKGSVRLSTDGEHIVRVMDSATGKPKDIRATELGMAPADLADMTAGITQMIGSMAAMRMGGGKGKAVQGMANRIGELVKMAAGQEVTAGIEDAGSRIADNQPVKPLEIAVRRSVDAAKDVAVGGALATAGKVGMAITTPAKFDAMTKQFREAVDYFKDKGFDLVGTPGEFSGIPLLQRSEAMARQLPGSSGTFKSIVDKQNSEMEKIQKVAMGLPPDATDADIAALPTREETGKKAIGAIADKVDPMKGAADAAKEDLTKTGNARITELLEQAAGPGPADTPKVGAALRESAMQKREAFKAASSEDYAKVYNHPEAQAYNLPADTIANKAQAMLKELPAPETISEKPTGIVDKFGNEILRDEAGQKIMRNFVPANVLTKLNDLAALKDGKFRLSDLIKMRTDVSNEIAQGEAIPGMNTHYLQKIKDMLTGGIEDGLGGLKDPNLKKLWQTANDNYAKGVKPFQKAGIAELFREGEQGNYIGDSAVVDRAMSGAKGADTFSAYKEFFGEKSPEFTGLKRAVVDRVVGQSKDAFSETINAETFVKNLAQLGQNASGVARDVFGPKAAQLVNISKAIAAGDSGEFVSGAVWKNRLVGPIDAKALNEMLKTGEPTAQKLVTLIQQEKTLATAYKNDLIKKIGTGDFSSQKLDPTKFVRYFSTQAEPEEVRQVVSLIHDRPDVLQEIKSKTVQDIFDRAYSGAKAIDNPSLLSGQPRVLTQGGLQDALGDATQREKYKTILGADTFKDLEQLTKFLAPRSRGEQAFSAAGGLAAGQQIGGLLRGGDLKYVGQGVKNWMLSSLYTLPGVRSWLGNQAINPENSAKTLRYLIASTPVVEAAYKEFGTKRAQQVMAEINASIDKNQQESTVNEAPKKDRVEAFRRMLDGR